jgi:hypothetical protein
MAEVELLASYRGIEFLSQDLRKLPLNEAAGRAAIHRSPGYRARYNKVTRIQGKASGLS